MPDQTPSPRPIAADCPCTLTTCGIRGDCEACVRVHRANKEHLPECMENLLRDIVAQLAHLVEYDVVEARPLPEQRQRR
jgi:hypothetical protein